MEDHSCDFDTTAALIDETLQLTGGFDGEISDSCGCEVSEVASELSKSAHEDSPAHDRSGLNTKPTLCSSGFVAEAGINFKDDGSFTSLSNIRLQESSSQECTRDDERAERSASSSCTIQSSQTGQATKSGVLPPPPRVRRSNKRALSGEARSTGVFSFTTSSPASGNCIDITKEEKPADGDQASDPKVESLLAKTPDQAVGIRQNEELDGIPSASIGTCGYWSP